MSLIALFDDSLSKMIRRTFTRNGTANVTPRNTHSYVKCRIAQAITNILQGRIAGVADDREHGLEGRMQADVTKLVLGRSRLQEFAIRIQLDGQEIRHIHDIRQLAKVLADTFFLSV